VVGDHQIGRLELPLDAVQGANRLSRNGPADDDLPAFQRGQVEGVQRVAEREHDVVGYVHDVGDRAHPGVEQARLEPDGRRADRHVAEEPANIARAAHEVLDGHVHGLTGCRLGVLHGDRRELELIERCDLASEPVDREQVGPVAGGLDEQHLLDEREDVSERRSRFGLGQHHDPGVVGSELDLVLGEDHPVGELAAYLPLLELQTAREHRTRERDRDGCARAKVPRAADDLPRLALADVHATELQPVGVRVLGGLEDLAHAEEAEVAIGVRDAAPLDALDLRGGDRQPGRQLVERHLDRDVVPQPGDGDAHQNCVRTLRSPSQSARMSGKSYFSCATRSIPQPKAKPLHSRGSSPTFSKTRGSTMPEPPISSQPE
jgi:hypothetical protein